MTITEKILFSLPIRHGRVAVYFSYFIAFILTILSFISSTANNPLWQVNLDESSSFLTLNLLLITLYKAPQFMLKPGYCKAWILPIHLQGNAIISVQRLFNFGINSTINLVYS